MDPITYAAITGTIGLITSFLGAKKASKAAKEQAAEEARIQQVTTAEQIRRLNINERLMFGQTVAGQAGSGVLGMQQGLDQQSPMSGSPQTILSEQAREFAQERKITQEVGASNVQQTLMRGAAQANAYKWQGYSNAASSISNILTNYKMMSG